MKLDIDNKILNLNNINNNDICKQKKNKDKSDKLNFKIKYLIGIININCIYKDYFYYKDEFDFESYIFKKHFK